MNNAKMIFILISIFVTNACSNSTPEIVSSLTSLQIPVVQPLNNVTGKEQNKNASLYSLNAKDISDLTHLLKERYLKGTNKKDIFDNHSMSHQIYICLTNLEEAKIINEQYFNEGNSQGLKELHEKLQPIIKGA